MEKKEIVDKVIQAAEENQKIELVVKQQYQEDEISLVELIERLLNGKKIIALCMAIALFIGVVGSTFSSILSQDTKGSVVTTLKINVNETDTVLAGFRNSFTIEDIKREKVIQTALENANLQEKISTEEMQSYIVAIEIPLEGKTPPPGLVKDYTISIVVPKSVTLTLQETQVFLEQLVEAYKQDITNIYVQTEDPIELISIEMNPQKYDYLEMKNVLYDDTRQMIDYVENTTDKMLRDRLWDYRKEAQLLKSTKLYSLTETINRYKLTKNPKQLLEGYTYKIQTLQDDISELSEHIHSLEQTIENYGERQTVIVVTDTGEITYPQEPYISTLEDRLVEQLAVKKQQLISTKADLQMYTRLKQEAERLIASDSPLKANEELHKQVEKDIQTVAKEVQTIGENITKTVDEYYQKEMLRNKISQEGKVSVTEAGIQMKKIGLSAAISLVLGLMLGVMWVLFKTMWDERKDGAGMKK